MTYQERNRTDLVDPVVAQNKKPNRNRQIFYLVLFLVIVAAIVIAGIVPRQRARAALRQETDQLAVPTVFVVHPKRASASQEIVLPANVQAYIDAPIYARTNGYLKQWYADIGARVKAGQLLATIDTPEVDQQLRQARADLATAEANLQLAKITADRYAGLLKTDSVSKQDADNAAGDYAAKQATVKSAEANVQRLTELQSFQKIYAPFDGVITARNTDIGQLIDSGSSGGPGRELFHIASIKKLRVYVNVPQDYSRTAKPGLTADLTFPDLPGKKIEGKLINTADAIDPASRTLLVQFEVDNSDGVLKPGAYAELHLKLPAGASSYIVPATSLMFRSEGLRLATVNNGKADLLPVTVGRDFGPEVEIVAGLTGSEEIIVNPLDSLLQGQQVRVGQRPPENAQ
ncbi:MAG TPA: efflux RND transporter periplasmic adaptor subunit [Terriglobales bacterium]|nr:efflux RND transporter periplasmic adaptor subunit [Terriglobales bacterium]